MSKILITGATSGIGHELAARLGARLVSSLRGAPPVEEASSVNFLGTPSPPINNVPDFVTQPSWGVGGGGACRTEASR